MVVPTKNKIRAGRPKADMGGARCVGLVASEFLAGQRRKKMTPQETRLHACPALRSVVNIDQTCPWRSALFELPAWLKRQER
jgi:hypothetical protein